MHDNQTIISRLSEYRRLDNKFGKFWGMSQEEFQNPVDVDSLKKEIEDKFTQPAPQKKELLSTTIPDESTSSEKMTKIFIGAILALIVIGVLSTMLQNIAAVILLVVVFAALFVIARIRRLKKDGKPVTVKGIFDFNKPAKKVVEKSERTVALEKARKSRKAWHEYFDSFPFEDEMNDFLKECVAYDEAFLEITDIYERNALKYSEARAKYEKMHAQAVKDMEETRNELEACRSGIIKDGIVAGEHMRYVLRILNNLETGRSGNYQEALNLAIEDVRKEEEEYARKQEAARQEEILRQQAKEIRQLKEAEEARLYEAEKQTKALEDYLKRK